MSNEFAEEVVEKQSNSEKIIDKQIKAAYKRLVKRCQRKYWI